MVEIWIDGDRVEAEDGQTVMQAARASGHSCSSRQVFAPITNSRTGARESTPVGASFSQ